MYIRLLVDVSQDMNVEYNKLINEQNQLKVKAESSLKRLQQLQTIYNSLMNKLEKGQKLSSFLSEQVIRIQKQRYVLLVQHVNKLLSIYVGSRKYLYLFVQTTDNTNIIRCAILMIICLHF